MSSDNHLMFDFRAGSEIAFQHFMKQHINALTFHAYRICRNKEVAEEIVADTFSKLWQRKESFEQEINIKSFLYITTRNACFDYMGSVQKRKVSQSVELDESLILREVDPLTNLIHAELIKSLMEEIKKLPERQAAVFTMHHFEGLSTDEICMRLAVTPNAVFVAKKKATDTIRKIFSERDVFMQLLVLQLLLSN